MWWELVWIALALVLVVVLPLITLYVRRRWIAYSHSAFDCALRFPARKVGAGWVLGLARYRGDRLEWFRSISLSLQPATSFRRGETLYRHRRQARGVEALELFDDSCVVTVADARSGDERNLAMDNESALALVSWLESAPPGSYGPWSGDTPG